jgi:hypothetical protein
MLFNTKVAALAHLLSLTAAIPTTKDAKPPAFFLAGDSTTAIQSTGGGGTFHHEKISTWISSS